MHSPEIQENLKKIKANEGRYKALKEFESIFDQTLAEMKNEMRKNSRFIWLDMSGIPLINPSTAYDLTTYKSLDNTITDITLKTGNNGEIQQ